MSMKIMGFFEVFATEPVTVSLLSITNKLVFFKSISIKTFLKHIADVRRLFSSLKQISLIILQTYNPIQKSDKQEAFLKMKRNMISKTKFCTKGLSTNPATMIILMS